MRAPGAWLSEALIVNWTLVPAAAVAGVAVRVMVKPPDVSLAEADFPAVVVVVVARVVVVVAGGEVVVLGRAVVVVAAAATVVGAAEVGVPETGLVVVVPAPGPPPACVVGAP